MSIVSLNTRVTYSDPYDGEIITEVLDTPEQAIERAEYLDNSGYKNIKVFNFFGGRVRSDQTDSDGCFDEYILQEDIESHFEALDDIDADQPAITPLTPREAALIVVKQALLRVESGTSRNLDDLAKDVVDALALI